MIVPIVRGENRHLLDVSTENRGLASVEISHIVLPLKERECVEITVTTDDDDVEVRVIVRTA